MENQTQDTRELNPILQVGSVNSIKWEKVIIATVLLFILIGTSFYIGHK